MRKQELINYINFHFTDEDNILADLETAQTIQHHTKIDITPELWETYVTDVETNGGPYDDIASAVCEDFEAFIALQDNKEVQE